uniref:Putative zinc finger protein n=1 Tax=Schistosoma mansoni TaxID=6183 RepID=A0A5K4EGY4_SCHMA
MAIPVSDFCFGITCKVEQPMGLDGVIYKSSNECISSNLNIGPEEYIKAEECNYDNTMDDSLIDNKLGILRDNHSLYSEDSFKHKYNSNDGHIVSAYNRHNGSTTFKRRQISSVQDSEEGVKPSCAFCNKTFSTRAGRDRHIKSIHKRIKYPCIQCDRKFTTKFHLIEHKKVIHQGINLSCDKCDRNFTTKSQLNRHIKSAHEGIKYPCNQCNKKLSTKYDLYVHKKVIHEGIKHPCNQCDRKFGTKSKLNDHIKVAHEGVTFPCDECGKIFSSNGALCRHLQSVHQGIDFFTKHFYLNKISM